MRKKMVLWGGGVLAALSIARLFTGSQELPCQCPVGFDPESKIPHISVEIGRESFCVQIDLGMEIPLSLDKTVLAGLKKVPLGVSKRADFRGNFYETPMYQIDAKVGSLSLKNIKAREESEKFAPQVSQIGAHRKEKGARRYWGRIGRGFFKNKNLLIDFPHSLLTICNQVRTENLEGFWPVPFQKTEDGIILKIETDAGIGKFVLDTGTTATVIRSTAERKSVCTKERFGLPVLNTSKFVIEGKDFGIREIYLAEISPLFDQIDGLLGMDFLKQHAIYLDFQNHIAYIELSK